MVKYFKLPRTLTFIILAVAILISSTIFTHAAQWTSKNNFASQPALDAHYQKHGEEFGKITQAQYLKKAQDLVNSEPGGDILTKTRSNGMCDCLGRLPGEVDPRRRSVV